ncbi:hypothetical protein T439DRAFT_383745 [Meredithblackwellia eburnea MCA 4105]
MLIHQQLPTTATTTQVVLTTRRKNFFPCQACRSARRRCEMAPAALGGGGRANESCSTCWEKGISCVGMGINLVPPPTPSSTSDQGDHDAVRQKRRRKANGAVMAAFRNTSTIAPEGTVSPSGVRSKLFQGELTLALTYHLIQEARSNPAWTTTSIASSTSGMMESTVGRMTTRRFEILQEGLKGLESGVVARAMGRGDQLMDVRIAIALVLGARRSNHSAIIGTNPSSSPTSTSSYPSPPSSPSPTQSSHAGFARQSACRYLADRRDAMFASLEGGVLAKEMTGGAVNRMDGRQFEDWIDVFRVGVTAMNDGEPFHSENWNPEMILNFDKLRLGVMSGMEGDLAEKERDKTLRRARVFEEVGEEIRFIDAKATIKKKVHASLTNSHLTKHHRWNSRMSEGDLRDYLATGCPPLPEEVLNRLSIDMSVIFYRGLQGRGGEAPLTHLKSLLSLLSLGFSLRKASPSLFQHRRRETFTTCEGGDLRDDFASWVGRARIKVRELVREIEVEDGGVGIAGEVAREVGDVLEEAREVMLWGALDGIAWLKSVLSHKNGVATRTRPFSSAETEAIASWSSYRAQEEVVEVGIENVRRLLSRQNQDLNEVVVVQEFGMEELKIMLAGQKIGSFIFGYLEEESQKLERAIEDLWELLPIVEEEGQAVGEIEVESIKIVNSVLNDLSY